MNNTILELWINNVDKFNQWRLENPFEQLDFSGLQLEGVNLSDAFLFGVNLSGCSFRKCIFQQCYFSHAIMDNTDFTGANLEYSVLGPVELFNASMQAFMHHLVQPASVKNCTFRNARLAYADFRETNIDGSDFTGAHLKQTRFINANYTDAIFDASAQEYAIFRNT